MFMAMRAFDPVLWSKQVEEICATDVGKQFYEFLEFWATAAEKMMEETVIVNTDSGDEEFRKYGPDEAVRQAFSLAEMELGRQAPVYIAQMLALLCTQWFYRDSLYESLTVIEKYFVQVALEAKIAQLGEDAAKENDGHS